MEELWKPVPGYEGLYEVSSAGRIRAAGKRTPEGGPVLVSATICCTGRGKRGAILRTCFWKDGVRKTVSVKKLVADAFIPNPRNLPAVISRDGNPRNCRADNLVRVSLIDARLFSHYGAGPLPEDGKYPPPPGEDQLEQGQGMEKWTGGGTGAQVELVVCRTGERHVFPSIKAAARWCGGSETGMRRDSLDGKVYGVRRFAGDPRFEGGITVRRIQEEKEHEPEAESEPDDDEG